MREGRIVECNKNAIPEISITRIVPLKKFQVEILNSQKTVTNNINMSITFPIFVRIIKSSFVSEFRKVIGKNKKNYKISNSTLFLLYQKKA